MPPFHSLVGKSRVDSSSFRQPAPHSLACGLDRVWRVWLLDRWLAHVPEDWLTFPLQAVAPCLCAPGLHHPQSWGMLALTSKTSQHYRKEAQPVALIPWDREGLWLIKPEERSDASDPR
ncbi:hypothetical protein B0T16DRAFT_399201 [Cercophora newfieldiana]|uniref:Uncharacterized protein n=1 Tax=Cercophora newfieldiana TaxID=92897 RepID=A0AA39YQP7_9PEZI|nr:hypothetical protein B0T16DRAFT_399201 [Cercophora newfieldiana]